VPVEVRVSGPFVPDEARVQALQITPRELQIFGLIADGLSNKEIRRAGVRQRKHGEDARKPGVRQARRARRTEAVQIGKSSGSIP